VPPLDLFVDIYPNNALRPEPYFMHDQEAPTRLNRVQAVTIAPPGHGAFASSTGDIMLGGKIDLLSEERSDRLGLGITPPTLSHMSPHCTRIESHRGVFPQSRILWPTCHLRVAETAHPK
jgi:hypothetical protein